MDDAFPIVVVLGLAVFGMFWIGSQASGNGFSLGLGGNQPDSMMLLSSNPGTVGESNEDFRTVNFGTFTVGEIRGDVQAYTAERTQISNGLIGGKSITIEYNATQPGQGQVSFEVLGRRSKGEIFVKVNGREVFSAATVSGATPVINISQNYFNSGMNRIVIGTEQSSIFQKAVYTLEDIEVTVEDRKFHAYRSYFQMYDHELDSFRPSNLTFRIPIDQSIPQEPLQVEVNGEQVFSQRIGRSTQEVTITPQNSDLKTGYNTIEFSTDGESKYTVKNAELQIRYSVNVQPARKNLDFQLSQNRLNYVERDNTKETLSFQYQRSTTTAPIQIRLNDAYYQIDPENGQNTVELGDTAFQQENTLTVSSNQTFTLQNLQIVSERQE